MFERFLGIFLIGLVIKLMDDFLDQDLDIMLGNWNFCTYLGRGIYPYGLVFMILALTFNYQESIGYFSASYLLGMAYQEQQRLPSGLAGWQESILIFLLAAFLTSLQNTLFSILLIFLLQLMDDYLDQQLDDMPGSSNLYNSLGRVNFFIISLILLVLALRYIPLKFLYFSTAVISLNLTFLLLRRYAFSVRT